MQENKKTNVTFKDKNNTLFKVEIEITHRNGYPEFSMTGEGNGHIGQCYDSIIKPKNSKQERLLELWKTYHLNGMNAGTPNQSKMIKEMTKTTNYEYEKAKIYLNSFDRNMKPITSFDLIEIEEERQHFKDQINNIEIEIEILEKESKKYTNQGNCWIVIEKLKIKEFVNGIFGGKQFFNKQIMNRTKKINDLKKLLEQAQEKTMLYDRGTDGKLYQYGATWHKVDLPKDLWKEVEELVKDIKDIEESNKTKGGDWDDIDDRKIVALGKYLELEPKEAEEDIKYESDGVYSYCGTEYIIINDCEAEDKVDNYLDEIGKDIWKQQVENDETECSFKEYKDEQIYKIGSNYGDILNSYDGTQYYDSELDLYIMRI